MGYTGGMADLILIAVVIVFFAVCAAYVRGLDRLVRASEETELIHAEKPE
jgi:hypothetical protein